MFAQGVGILPLIKQLKSEFPDVAQPQYTWQLRCTRYGCKHRVIFHFYSSWEVDIALYPLKNIIVHLENIYAQKMFGLCNIFKVCSVARYLGGFIRYDESKRDWLKEYTDTWDRNIHTIRESVGRYPQKIYTTVACAIQLEWTFLQRITKIWQTRSRECRRCFGKYFCLAFSSESQNLSHPLQ